LLLFGLGHGLGCQPSLPHQVSEFNQQGLILLQQQNYTQAQERFQEAHKLNPDDPTTYYNLGVTAVYRGEEGEAERQFLRCLEREKGHVNSRRALHQLMLKQNRVKEVQESVERWTREQPTSAAAHAERGWFFRQQGDYPAAVAELDHALELDPHNLQALTERARLFELYNYPDRARSLYERVLRKDPSNREVAMRLAGLRAKALPRPDPEPKPIALPRLGAAPSYTERGPD
jgi:Tfp pilus assembly protein PilF